MALLDIDVILRKNTAKEMVDEMFNQFFTVRDTKHEKLKGKTFKTEGHYLKARNSEPGKQHAFDMLAHVAEKYTKEFYDNDRDKMNMEDLLQDARLDLYELLLKLGNGDMKGFEMHSIDDFKALLLNEDESMRARSYILKSVKSNMYKRTMCEGKLTGTSLHIYGNRVQKDGKRTIEWKTVKWMDIDKKVECECDDVENTVLEMHLLKQSLLNNDIENLFSIDLEDSIYKYILDNKENIFTKKQLEYLKYILAGNDKRKYKSDYEFSCARVERNIAKKAIEKLEDNKYFYIVNGQLRQKQINFLETVESIVNADSTLEQFFLIQSVLCDNDTVLNKMFTDLIYELDERILRDLVFCLTDTVDENWLETEDFRKIIEVLVNEYNFQVKNAKLIYNYNVKKTIDKHERLKNYIEKNCFFVEGNEFGYVAKSKNDKGIPNLEEIKDEINKIFNTKVEKKQVRNILEELGYLVDVYNRTTKNKTACYKVFRKHSE